MHFRKFFALTSFLSIALNYNVIFASTKNNSASPIDTIGFESYKGLVVDHKSGSPLAFASVLLKGTNISTVTNAEGYFLLKVPKKELNRDLIISFLGYKNKIQPIKTLHSESNRFEMDALPMLLPEISVLFSDADDLMRAVIQKKGDNYLSIPAIMTAFYRETIKKRKSYVSLLEAVVDVYKYPYTSFRQDLASLYKVRKNTDYQKLDTMVFKLMGGPYNTLYADIMRYSDDFFTDNMSNYDFSFDKSTRIDDRTIYVVNFKQNPTYLTPLFHGKLYIDAQSLALIKAEFGLNLENRDAAAQIFIKKKPLNAKAYPTRSKCTVDYLQRDGKWYMSYCRVELDIYIDWKRKLFNTLYESTMEMAVTDWVTTSSGVDDIWVKPKDKLKINTIVADKTSGFVDPAFWGESNVIEPEKSIETAIRKINKQLRKK